VQSTDINKEIKQQHTRLRPRACVEAKDGHVKHNLWRQV